ncbi:MAG: GTPase ObgE, partial [Anaerolineales bacterium]|nr:GTPase ObgE [Anaerolineales bacterium]
MISDSAACGKRGPVRPSAIIALYMAQNELRFIDEVSIRVQAGAGGNGIVHFRREKHVPTGGPDGGDGGDGGSVFLVVDDGQNTLLSFQRQRNFRAQNGRHGGGSNKTGRSGPDLAISVPPGTITREKVSGALLGDLTEGGQSLQVARGGKGGRGNARFATSGNRAPRVAEKGEPGETCDLALELRLIADVGIVGVPNAGKSTFLASVSAARPKIADYPFTTLAPNLGVAEVGNYHTLVLADIPGLIEGAHAGVGLGAAFLRHVQRTRVLIHLVDGLSEEPLADFSQIQSELALFESDLAAKPQVVALNKVDLPEVAARLPTLQAQFSARGHELRAVSAMSGQGVRQL